MIKIKSNFFLIISEISLFEKQLIEDNVQPKDDYADLVTSGGLIDVLATVQAVTGDQPPSKNDCNFSTFPAFF